MFTKITNKLKNLKPVYLIAGVSLILISIVVVYIMLPSPKQSSIKVAEVPHQNQKNLSQSQTSPPPSVIETLEQEKDLQLKQKKYLGGVSPQQQRPQSEEEIEERVRKILEQEQQDKITYSSRPQRLPVDEENKDIDRKTNKKKELFSYFLTYTPALGVAKTEPETAKDKSSEQKLSLKEKPFDIKDLIIFSKYYKAKAVNTISSNQSLTEKPRFIAQIVDNPLKGGFVFGRISSTNFNDNKINIIFDTLELDKKQYKISARAFSLDKNEGISTVVKYNDPAKIQTVGLTSFASAMLDALREDYTASSYGIWGVETTQRKASNRVREGLLAGGSSAFAETKRIVEDIYRQLPPKEVIFEKDNYFYILFESVETSTSTSTSQIQQQQTVMQSPQSSPTSQTQQVTQQLQFQ